MPQRPEPWSRHQRDRWLRHDAHRFIRHDVKRFLAPGTDPADVYPALARQREREEAAFAAEIAKGYRLLATLRAEVASIKADLLRRRLAEQIKYSPTQPRVPAGNPRGGQWTDRSGGQGTGVGLSQDAGQSQDTGSSQDADLSLPMGNVDVGDISGSNELDDLFKIKPSVTRVGGVRVAAADSERFYTPVLAEEEDLGGHLLRRHTDRTDTSLIDRLNTDYQRVQTGNLEITDFATAEGTFLSREQATDLVSQVLKQNTDEVDKVAAGKINQAKLEGRFDFVTGKEAFRPNGDSDPYIRDTYGVRVIIRHDMRSWRGYRVHTAYPIND
jgi:hypothetical protein